MSTSEIHASSHLSGHQITGSQSSDHIHDIPGILNIGFNYGRLIDFYLRVRGIDKDGKERPDQSLKNELSGIESWLACHGLNKASLVGEELGVRFLLGLVVFLSSLEDKGLAKTTIRDRKTVAHKLRESFLELWRTSDLPEDFGGALKKLVEKAGVNLAQLSKNTGIPRDTLCEWIDENTLPLPKSLPRIRKLERALKVSPGTLSLRLPEAHWSKGRIRSCTTPWRRNQSVLLRFRYRLLVLTPRVQEEWDDLRSCYTDPQWASEHGITTSSEWRIRWNNNRCPTADMKLACIRSFLGYLCLPVTATDKRIEGLGFNKEDLTLALLTDADLVIKYLYFMKGRTVSDTFNGGTTHFLTLCTMLTRVDTGYLRQRPEFGAKLPCPVAASDWSQWCEDNRLKLTEFATKITSGKNGKGGNKSQQAKSNRVRMTRNPFEPVIDIIRQRQHPITALFDLADRLESLTPPLEKGSKVPLATHSRSIFQVRLISSNPLRSENFSMMTYIPKNQASFKRACEQYDQYRREERAVKSSTLYVETTNESNLHQKPDGSWRLRFNERDFKNEKGEDVEEGVLIAPYDVEIVPSVWPALIDYIFKHRRVLNADLLNVVKQIRAKRDRPALTLEEELKILHCPYVFRPEGTSVHRIKAAEILDRYGWSPVRPGTFSKQMFYLTSRYLPESKGFCAHACRHLVATEYIKNHPNGWDVAAAALHNTAAMVRKHYSRIEAADEIKPWNNYHEEIKAKHDRGEL